MVGGLARRSARRGWGRVLVLSGVLALVVSLGGLLAGARGAAANPHHDLRGSGVLVDGYWFGSYRTFGGNPWVWCIDAGKGSPFSDYKWESRRVTAPSEAYLLWAHASDTSEITHAALSYLMHTSSTLPHDRKRAIADDAPTRHGKKFAQRIEELRAEADRYAGPYEVLVRFTDAGGKKLRTAPLITDASGAQVHISLEIRSASGHQVPDVPMALEVHGAQASTKGPLIKQVRSATKPVTVPIQVVDAGTVSVQAAAKTPPVQVEQYESTKAQVQRVVGARGREIQKADDSISIREQLQVAVATQASEAELGGAGDVFDYLDVSVSSGQWPENIVIPIHSTLYGPFDTVPELSANVPVDAPLVASVITEVTGPGQWHTPTVHVAEPGWYVWHEVVEATADFGGWSGEFGVAAETFQVLPEPDPEPEPEPGPEPEPEPGPEPESSVENVAEQVNDRPQLPRTGASLALGLIGGGSLLTGQVGSACGRAGVASTWGGGV